MARRSGTDPWDEEQYTLAQLARRVGISEGRARAMWAEGDRLPRPDGNDADHRPLWRASTIDRWCRQTGRSLPPDAKGLDAWPDAAEPAPVMFSGEVVLPVPMTSPRRVFVIVWDTPHGHVVQVDQYEYARIEEERAARAVLQVLEPVFWPDAVVITPAPMRFGWEASNVDTDVIDAHVIVPSSSNQDGLGQGLWRLLKFPSAFDTLPSSEDPQSVEIKSAGLYYPEDIARILGRPMPVWVAGSLTSENARRFDAFGQLATFSVPDTTTPWPATRERLGAALDWRMHERFPQAFAALARDALSTLQRAEQDHHRQQDRGRGWYLVARPARPDWPVTLDRTARIASETAIDLVAASHELEELRSLEAESNYPDYLGEALYEATRELASLLYEERPDLVFDACITENIVPLGPVAEEWLNTLEALPDEEVNRLRHSRRIASLISPSISRQAEEKFGFVAAGRGRIRTVWRDYAGRLALRLGDEFEADRTVHLEWPAGLPRGWDEQTVIAADPDSEGGVFALTPVQDGRLRADPLPNPGSEPGYTWGYDGSGPRRLYMALVRCALGAYATPPREGWVEKLVRSTERDQLEQSALWQYIRNTASDSPIRLSWTDVCTWVREDRERYLKAER